MPKQRIKIALILSTSALILSALLQASSTTVGSIYPVRFISATIANTIPFYSVTQTRDSEQKNSSAVKSQMPVYSDTSESFEQSEVKTKAEPALFLNEQKCPFVAHEQNIVIPLEGENSHTIYISEGYYTAELASKKNDVPFSTEAHDGWFITLSGKQDNLDLSSGVARTVYNDERMVVELVEGIRTIEDGEYTVSVEYEHNFNYEAVTPLCVLLRYSDIPEELFPKTETRVLNDIKSTEDGFTQDFETKFDSIKNSFDEKKEDSITEFNKTVDERFDSDLFKPSTTTTYRDTGSEQASTHDEYYTGENNEIYVEVSTYSESSTDGTKNVTLLKDLAEKREELLSTFKEETLFELLQEKQEFMQETKLPELIQRRKDLFGEVKDGIDLTRRSIEDIAIMKDSTTDTKEALEAFHYEKKDELEDGMDSDGDGITDYDEAYIYQSDPHNPFTSGSVLSDGERVLLGLDPSRADYRVLPVESARQGTGPVSKHFSVDTIEYENIEMEQKAVKIKGRAQPYSFVTLYLYSTPIIVTIRSDKNGVFTYTLDAQLENGEHELYVATVNSTGKILAQSNPHPFIKTAEAITYMPANVSEIEGPVDTALQKLVAVSLLLTLLCAIGITMTIGYMKSKDHKNPLQKNLEHEEKTD